MMSLVNYWRPFCVCFGLAGLVSLTFFISHSQGTPPSSALLSSTAVAQPSKDFEANHIIGSRQCVDCHVEEYRVWKKSRHANGTFNVLYDPKALKYAEELDIEPADIDKDSLCLNCHATVQNVPEKQSRVLAGVSCESCHNAAGGEDGWLNFHASYGVNGFTRQEETSGHRKTRQDYCVKSGQLGSSQIYEMARRCFGCHIVGNEELVIAGHKSASGGSFEFAKKSLDDSVRHNFHMNQQENAEVSTLWLNPLESKQERTTGGRKRVMFVIGQMADLSVSLENLAKATDEDEDYFADMSERIIDAYEKLLEDVAEELEEELPLLQEVLDECEPIYTKLDDEEFSLDDDKPLCIAAAKIIDEAAKKFAAKHDGSMLSDIDEP